MNVAYSIRSIAFDVIERRVTSRKATSFLLKVTTLGVDNPHDTSHLASRAHRSIQVLSSATVDSTVTPPPMGKGIERETMECYRDISYL